MAGHHAANLWLKLDVRSLLEAAMAALRLGVLNPLARRVCALGGEAC